MRKCQFLFSPSDSTNVPTTADAVWCNFLFASAADSHGLYRAIKNWMKLQVRTRCYFSCSIESIWHSRAQLEECAASPQNSFPRLLWALRFTPQFKFFSSFFFNSTDSFAQKQSFVQHFQCVCFPLSARAKRPTKALQSSVTLPAVKPGPFAFIPRSQRHVPARVSKTGQLCTSEAKCRNLRIFSALRKLCQAFNSL